jgi:hypothetical protein
MNIEKPDTSEHIPSSSACIPLIPDSERQPAKQPFQTKDIEKLDRGKAIS